MSKPKYKYKIVKEDADDFRNSVILKKGIEAEFTVSELNRIEKEVRKQLKESTAQYNLEAAKCDNIERNHEYVRDFTEEQLFTIHLYAEARKNYKKYKDHAEKIERDLATYEGEMAEMYTQLGKTPTPYGTELEGAS